MKRETREYLRAHHTPGEFIDSLPDAANLLKEADLPVTDFWFHRKKGGEFVGAIVIGAEDEVYSWHTSHGWSHRAGSPGQWGPYKTTVDLGLGADTPAEDVVATIVKEEK